MGIEILGFNYDVFESLFFKSINTKYDLVLSEGLYYNDDDTITIVDPNKAYIKLQNINENIDNMLVNLQVTDVDYIEKISINVLMTDEGNKEEFYYAGTHDYLKNSIASHYLRLHSYGKVKNIILDLSDLEGHCFFLNSIQFNKRVPLHISWLRIALMFLFSMFIEVYRPKSKVYSYKFSMVSLKKPIFLVIITGSLIAEIGIFNFLIHANPMFTHNETSQQYMQYEMLAESLSKGKFELQITPENDLMNLENPYDPTTRKEFHLDHAFYQGKYYVYFGVVPAIMFYLPYYIITGNGLENATVILFSLSIFAVGVFLLLYEFVKQFFPNIPISMYLLAVFVIVNGSGAIYIARKPDIYSVPIAVSLMLIVWGLWFWLKAARDPTKLSRIDLFLGSICLSLVAGCRPQMVLVSFLAFPLFWNTIKKILTNKEACLDGIVAILPFLIIAAGLMFYNFKRFDSPFDFGANYNLTTNDMTKRGFDMARIGTGIYEYLFRLPNYSLQFPYIYNTSFSTDYLGITIYEPMFGGFLMTHLICWILGISFWIKSYFNNRIKTCITILIFISGVIIVMDTQMAGILPRYISDFSFFVLLASILTLFTVMLHFNDRNGIRKVLFFISILCLLGICYDYLMLFIYDQSNLSVQNPYLFYKIMGLIQY